MSEDFKIFVEDFAGWLNSQEAGIVKLKTQIAKVLGETKPSPKLPFDVSKIRWQDRENEKGKYQVSEDYNSLNHKALLKFLNEHAGGCINSKDSEGNTWFIWLYRNGSTIGRKKRKQA
jgi:hypothetical protein